MYLRSALYGALLAAGCHTPPPGAAPPVASSPPDALRAVGDPQLGQVLRDAGANGVIAVLEDEAQTVRCSDPALCSRRFLPASTFKIANSLIGLETGVVADADFALAWDGAEHPYAAWNHDHTLRSAIRESVVWYYQELARRVGRERMQVWLRRLHYGNAELGPAVDRFWLDGPTAISPLEQVEFLRRLARARLPVSARTRDIVLDIITLGELDGQTLRGKTGWGHAGQPGELGWFVGYVIGPDGAHRYVAALLFNTPRRDDFISLRRQLAEAALRTRWQLSAH